jgi:hypothetical protein
MQNQRSTDRIWLPDSDEVARIILNVLIQRHPSLIEIDELLRELAQPALAQRIDNHSSMTACVISWRAACSTGSTTSSSRLGPQLVPPSWRYEVR